MRRIVPFLAALVTAFLILGPAGAQKPDIDLRTTEIGGKLFDQWMKELQDTDPSVVEGAIRAIGNFGRDGRRAIPDLIRILTKPGQDTSLKVNAIITLGSVGPEDSNPQRVVDAIINYGLQERTQGIVRFQAALALARIGPKAKGGIGYLTQFTVRDNTSWEIRKAAVYALGLIGVGDKDQPADARAVNALVDRLDNDACGQIRMEAVLGLSTLAPTMLVGDFPRIFPKVQFRAEKDRDKAVAIYARLLMAQMDPKFLSEPNLRVIASFLLHGDMQVRLHACRALQMLGDKAKFTIPELINALKDRETMVATGATSALMAMKESMGDREFIRIAELLKAQETYVRGHAAQALAAFGEKAKGRVPELISALTERDPAVLVAVVVALAEMGEAAKPAIASLQALTQHPNEDVRDAAVATIEAINNPNILKPKKP